eukprot:m.55130 g.55130  ORF g.55130 m.55130 type:complete len:301 (+) comp7742_c0_seq1:178-1080(+)
MMMMKIAFFLVATFATITLAQMQQQQQRPPCRFLGVTEASDCNKICNHMSGSSPSFSDSVCTCMVQGSTVTLCNNDRPAPYLLHILDQLAPAQCQPVYREVLHDDVLDCFLHPMGLSHLKDFGNFSAPFDPLMCQNRCVALAFRAASIFASHSNGMMCADTLSVVSDNNDTTPFNVSEIESVRERANLVCAEGGMGHCGDLGPIIHHAIDSGNITAAQCMTINNRGKCLGNIKAFFNRRGSHENGTEIVAFLNKACSAKNIDITPAASTGTEPPADISSGSFVTGSLFAIAAATLIALLF